MVDPEHPHEPSTEEMAQLKSVRDEDIDLSDIPEQTGIASWRRPGLDGLRRSQLLVVDADVAEYFRQDHAEASQQMNAVLREYVEAQRKRA